MVPVQFNEPVSALLLQLCQLQPPTIARSTMPKQATTKAALASLSGSGQHYALELEIPGVGADAKDVTLTWALPAAAYVDKDEVETRGSWPACINKVQFTGTDAQFTGINKTSTLSVQIMC